MITCTEPCYNHDINNPITLNHYARYIMKIRQTKIKAIVIYADVKKSWIIVKKKKNKNQTVG